MPVQSGTQYADRADLEAIGLIASALAAISPSVQDAALLAASSVADSYLQSRYQLPLVTWGKDLARVVAVIAAYDLLSARGYNPMAGADVNWRQRYLDALAWLDQVSKGEQSPSYLSDSSGATSGGPIKSTAIDGSIVTTTQGGFSVTTSDVRGWTGRGGSTSGWQP